MNKFLILLIPILFLSCNLFVDDEPDEEEIVIKILDWRQPSNDQVEIDYTITNNGDEEWNFARSSFICYTETGYVVAYDTLRELLPGYTLTSTAIDDTYCTTIVDVGVYGYDLTGYPED